MTVTQQECLCAGVSSVRTAQCEALSWTGVTGVTEEVRLRCI